MSTVLKQKPTTRPATRKVKTSYVLEEQVGFILRQVTQRHIAIFGSVMVEGLTSTQFSVINMLERLGSCSQNQLGRLVAMDAATVKGVIDRLTTKGITQTTPDPNDARQLLVSLTQEGLLLAEQSVKAAQKITEQTLAPLTPTEQRRLLGLLKKIA